ncbi:site-specific DNA-methyltransferase, partial [Chloroflexota bacterium]
EIKQAKGRPMLTWVGKRPLRYVTAFSAQHIESFDPGADAEKQTGEIWNDWSSAYPKGALLFHGDNKEVLAHLLANGFRGKVQLIYIDPPFDSGADYVRKVKLHGLAGNAKLEGEGYSLGEQIQYTDIWANDNYLQFMYERLLLMKELLADTGSIYLHTDWHKSHLLRCLMDEVFGDGGPRGEAPGYKGEVAWCYKTRQFSKKYWNRKHQCILFYTKSDQWTFNWETVLNEYSEATIKKFKFEDEKGKYRLVGRGIQDSPIRSAKDVDPKWEKEHPELVVRDYLKGGYPPEDWMVVDIENQASIDRQNYDYPTLKPKELIRRIIRASSNEGDLIMDCFVGAGTTAAVAQRLGRRWIGCDINKGSIQTTSKRLQTIIFNQIETEEKNSQQKELLPNDRLTPAQLSFATYRVNDYDLQIQHNEAVDLACEHVGITRTKADSFFEGTLGNKLAKIIPFNHPLTLVDLDEIKRELEARPEESRDVTVVALGKETVVDAWVDDWNRLLKKGNLPNKISVIELRTDPKYGKFFEHRPSEAKVKIQRSDGRVRIDIEDFISPTVIERLKQQFGVLTPKIDDWRAMVDSVMIDTSYDGGVFEVAYSDVPEKKDSLVDGHYELECPASETTIAVKITDVLGEEVIVAEKI